MKRFLVLLPLSLGGCSSMMLPSAAQMGALAGDPAAICFTITSVWAAASFDRNHGCPGNAGTTPVIIMTPGGITPTHVEVIKP